MSRRTNTPASRRAPPVRRNRSGSRGRILSRDSRKRIDEREFPLFGGHLNLEQILDSTDAFIAILDAQCRFTFINRQFAKALGRPSDAIIGKKMADLVPQSAQSVFQARCKSVLEGKQVTFEHELTLPGIDKPLWFSGTHSPIFGEQDKVSAFITVMLDITRQKQASDSRIEHERLVVARKLARTVAHEFRQPLTALRLISDISQMDLNDSDFLSRNFDKIPTLVNRIDDLVGRLLYITSLQSKPYLHDMEILDLESAHTKEKKQPE